MNQQLAFLFASGVATTSTTNCLLRSTTTPSLLVAMEEKSHLRRQSMSAVSLSSAISSSSENVPFTKPRILCLHGKFQSASIFRNKIAGARRKLEREYELHFLNGPILLENENDEENSYYAWWERTSDGQHTLVKEAFDYIIEQTKTDTYYDAIIGFSQGGTFATALAISGVLPNVQCICTAGAPYVHEAFEIALELSNNSPRFDIPKLHLAGETDAMVSVESTRKLSEEGGCGELIIHDQGHLYPTRSARVKEILSFLSMSLKDDKNADA